jgi:hypothetical protein
MSEEKWVAVRPDGTVCGPIGDDAEFVWASLVIGYQRNVHGLSKDWARRALREIGYKVRRARIELIREGG